jgi:hypothetical protein
MMFTESVLCIHRLGAARWRANSDRPLLPWLRERAAKSGTDTRRCVVITTCAGVVTGLWDAAPLRARPTMKLLQTVRNRSAEPNAREGSQHKHNPPSDERARAKEDM